MGNSEKQVSKNQTMRGMIQGQINISASPLPLPEILAKYDQIVPGAGATIIEMAKNQSTHRIETERKVIESREKQSWWGLWTAFIIALSLIGLIVFAIAKDKDVLAGILASSTIIALVYVFRTGKVWQAKSVQNNNNKSNEKEK
jgi:uncharacterized membrane protein